MALKIMAGIGAALFIVGILLTCATMLFTDITWHEVADVLSESRLHVAVRSQDGGWRSGLGFFHSDDGPFTIRFGNKLIEIDW